MKKGKRDGRKLKPSDKIRRTALLGSIEKGFSGQKLASGKGCAGAHFLASSLMHALVY